MWEWRIFFKEDFSNEFELSSEFEKKINNNPLEIRTDYYYDLSRPDIGLKERGSSQGKVFRPILELKVLLQKKQWGAELWKKFINYPINKSIDPDKGLSIYDIIEILQYERDKIPMGVKIEPIISNLEKKTQNRIPVKKERVQMNDVYRFNHSRSKFKLERTKVHILGENWQTICIESPNSELLRDFVRNQVLNIPDNVMGGYPEFILTQRKE